MWTCPTHTACDTGLEDRDSQAQSQSMRAFTGERDSQMREGTTGQRVRVSSLRKERPQRTASKVVGPQSYSHRELLPAT